MMRGSNSLDGSSPAAIPRVIGKYCLITELGHGGMANVFLAVAKGPNGFNKLVVLKALLPSLADDKDSVTNFLDEANLAARLNHNNVVHTYEVGQEGEHYVIVMEYLEGQSLHGIIMRSQDTNQPLPLGLHLRAILDALEGLQCAHELKDFNGAPLHLVHRDVSPHNVFVTYDGVVKVLDFGIAKASTSSTNTEAGMFKGKIAYMAPERLTDTQLDPRVDVFAVGAMLWEVATGTRLWRGVQQIKIMHRLLAGDIPLPETVNANVDSELRRITLKALHPDRTLRYATARELQSDLETYVSNAKLDTRNRTLGHYVSELFVDTREKLKEVIEQELATIALTDSGSVPGGGPVLSTGSYPNANQSSGRNQPFASNAGLAGTHSELEATPAQGRSRTLWIAAIGLGLMAAIFAFAFLKTRPSPNGNESGTASVVVQAPTKKTVDIRLSALPSEAKIYVNEELVTNPSVQTLPADSSRRSVRAEAPGHKTQTEHIELTSDQVLRFALQKEAALAASVPPPSAATPRYTAPAAPRGKGRAGADSPAAPADAPPPAKSKQNCDKPFFINNAGIKSIRPECL